MKAAQPKSNKPVDQGAVDHSQPLEMMSGVSGKISSG
jgi:hypothetical protein